MKNKLDESHKNIKTPAFDSPILSVKNLGRQIQNRWLWQDLNFELYSGERVAVLGVSGSGKSLLLRVLAGLDTAQSGQIIFGGKSINSHFLPHYRSQIIYLHQRPALWEGTVEENLKQVYRLTTHRHKVYNRQLILEYLHLLHRDADFLQRPVSAISGGEGQIVAFLRALQLSPRVLLLDEPTASLDGSTANSLEALIAAWLHDDPERAYLWTSHDPHQLQRLTTRQITLNGRNNGN
ncbi:MULTISPECIES: ABC transporter ATP-binding protein [Nostoc]|uniref:ATP-binding cassette domain-containing protein n=2 Tax=Nostoc TaxID=1177 RepID=A0ABR8I2Z1_9NOSO|nr:MULTISPECIES: ATP-binding cassette domain-containing protein [Nostoc]MBD2561144.1 ATP-binding cassette domain-containing protein [Nostoc linckia FACHB-391]MBD2645907.1 ATP-binding cassette domain-containing protein [Nostoc foliaceum FACHB-393]